MRPIKNKSALAVAAIAILLVAGISAAVVSAQDSTTASDSSTTYDLQVTVAANVEGDSINMTSAVVDLYTCTTSTSGNTTTITIEKVAESTTNSSGAASFELAEGKYFVVASYDGLLAIKEVYLSGDNATTIVLHNYHITADNANITKLILAEDGLSDQSASGTPPACSTTPTGMDNGCQGGAKYRMEMPSNGT